MSSTARKREYRAFPRLTDGTPLARHCRDTETTRETIRRPFGAVPRTLKDWR